MKKFIWIIIATLSFVSCSESNEEKAEKLIKNEMNKVLVNIDTYEPIETVIDSAYAPVMTADVFNKCFNLPKQLEMLFQLKKEAEEAYDMMNIYKSVPSRYSGGEYDRYKNQYESASKKAEEMENRLKSLNDSIEELAKVEPYFNGYIINHKFRYVTKNGDKSIGTFLFLMNKDISAIEFMIDTEDENFKTMGELIQLNNTLNH